MLLVLEEPGNADESPEEDVRFGGVDFVEDMALAVWLEPARFDDEAVAVEEDPGVCAGALVVGSGGGGIFLFGALTVADGFGEVVSPWASK